MTSDAQKCLEDLYTYAAAYVDISQQPLAKKGILDAHKTIYTALKRADKVGILTEAIKDMIKADGCDDGCEVVKIGKEALAEFEKVVIKMTPSPDKTPDLMPCPFCGGDPQTDYWDVGKPMHTVECRACFGMCYSSDNEKAAIKSWNTRQPAQKTVMPERISLKTLNWMLADVPTGGEAAFLMDNFKNGIIIIDDQKQVKP